MELYIALSTILILSILCVEGSPSYGSELRTSNNAQNEEEWWSNWNYSIDQGQCSGRKVATEEVRKEAEPYTVKKTIYNWDGQKMYRITCVRIQNRMYNDRRAGKARIVKGGVGYSDVKIEMSSQISEGFHFNVEIYGEPLQSSRQNIAIMTDPNSRTLYYGGQKYCACN